MKKSSFEGNTHHEAIRMKLKDYRHIEEPLVGSFIQQPSTVPGVGVSGRLRSRAMAATRCLAVPMAA